MIQLPHDGQRSSRDIHSLWMSPLIILGGCHLICQLSGIDDPLRTKFPGEVSNVAPPGPGRGTSLAWNATPWENAPHRPWSSRSGTGLLQSIVWIISLQTSILSVISYRRSRVGMSTCFSNASRQCWQAFSKSISPQTRDIKSGDIASILLFP